MRHPVTIKSCGKHPFHYKCIKLFLEKYDFCPLCNVEYDKLEKYELPVHKDINIQAFVPFNNVIREIIWKLSTQSYISNTFKFDEFTNLVLSKICEQYKQYFHKGSTCYAMDKTNFSFEFISSVLYDSSIKYEIGYDYVNLYS